MNNKKWIVGVIIAAAVLLVGAGVFWIINIIGGVKPETKPEKTHATADVTRALSTEPYSYSVPTEPEKEEIPYPEVPEGQEPDFDPTVLREYIDSNPDVYSWITIPDTNVDYPVAQSMEDDNFYLDHDVEKNYSFPGTIYSQLCNSVTYRDRVTLLYGHNMLNGSMFADLHRFRDADFFDTHPYFYIYTHNSKLTYEIVTAFDYDDRHIPNSFDFKNDEVFESWLEQARNPHSLSAHTRDSSALNLDAKIVVLSTCQNSGDGRYLVQGVLVKAEPYAEL